MLIDFHCHYFPRLTEAKMVTRAARLSMIAAGHHVIRKPEEVFASLWPLMMEGEQCDNLIRCMDEAGVDVAVYFPQDTITDGTEDTVVLEDVKYVSDAAKRYPGRIIPFASIDTRRKNAPELLRRCVEDYGAKGIKFHPDRGYDALSEQSYRVLEGVQEYGIVFMMHCCVLPPPSRNRLVHPMVLDDISIDFPKLKIVAAHSGGLLRKDWCAYAALNPAIHGDLAMYCLEAVANYPRFCRELRDMLDVVGPKKLVFGTDWPVLEPLVPAPQFIDILRRLPKEAPDGLQFTEEEIEGILGANARSVLGI